MYAVPVRRRRPVAHQKHKQQKTCCHGGHHTRGVQRAVALLGVSVHVLLKRKRWTDVTRAQSASVLETCINIDAIR